MLPLIPPINKRPDLGIQIFHTRESPTLNRLPVNNPKPYLHQIQPRAAGRSEMHTDLRMTLQPVLDLLGLMSGIVIHH